MSLQQIYWFSGTGNARKAAQWIAEDLASNGIAAKLIRMQPGETVPETNQDKLIGFCYPTHGFNAPPLVLKYFYRFPRGKNRVFLLNTRAGLKLSKLHLPGIGGLALWLPFLILWLKGYKVRAFRPLDMPSNWISLHPGLREKVVRSIHRHCRNTIHRFSHRLKKGEIVLNGLYWLPIDILLFPIAVGYYLYGRFALSKTFFASYQCTNCGKCIRECPVSAIREIQGRPFWTYRCESCMRCMNYCPERAIETAHGITFLIWRLVFVLIPAYSFHLLGKHLIPDMAPVHGLNGDLLYMAFLIPGMGIIILLYRSLHYLLRFKWFNKLITWTSLTHLPFWRRYKCG